MSSCAAKRRYPTKALAERSLQGIRNKGDRRGAGKPNRAYLCPHCKGWHLTSKPQ